MKMVLYTIQRTRVLIFFSRISKIHMTVYFLTLITFESDYRQKISFLCGDSHQ